MTVKIASPNVAAAQGRELPQECVACRNQQPGLLHIDFDAEADRGWYGDDPSTEVTLENVIVCITCLREAMAVAGIEDSEPLKAENVALKRKNDVLRKRLEQAQRYKDALEDAFDKRPEPIRLDHRKKPRKIREEAPVGQ